MRQGQIYQAIKEENETYGYPISALCKLGNVSRSAYYKWLHREIPANEIKNLRISDAIEKIHTDSPDKGYRRIRDDLERYYGIKVNDKRVLRICRKKNIKSTIKYANNGCTRQSANPQYIAENVLNREFFADAPNQKWLTDVTEFKYYIGLEKHKVYLSAILDLYDRRIVSYVIRDNNNNALVFDTFDNAIASNPEACPLCHSDRGFQYTNRSFHNKLEAAGMIDKAGRLFAQVNMDEAQRSLEASQKETAVLQNALRTLLNITDTCSIQPVSPLFINAVLPAKEEFLQTMQTENYTVNQLQLQSHIAKQQLRIEQSGYLPDIAVFGKQTLYAHGIQSNLIPRTMIGVGFTWNLFDGLAREKRIRQSKIAQQTLSIGQEKAKDDLSVGIDKLYTQMQKAQDNVRALNTTIELSEELVRIRKKSFTEGMATSTEVIDSETMLATVRVARLAAYYEYDVALMNLLALCGTPEEFGKLSNLRVEN